MLFYGTFLRKIQNAPANLFNYLHFFTVASMSVLQGQKIIDILFCAFYTVSNHIGNKMLVKLGYSKIYQFTFSFTEESNILPAPRRPLL